AGEREASTTLRDAFGEVTLTVDPMGRETATLFDKDGEAVETITGFELDPSQWRTAFQDYDEFGDVTLAIDPLSREEEFSYDLDDEEQGDVEGYGSGRPEPQVQYHDAQGNLTGVLDAAGSLEARLYDG